VSTEVWTSARETGATQSRRWLWLLAGMWLLACGWLLMQRWSAIASMTFPDADDNIRLLQVRDWLAGQGWFDLRQYRFDPPVGANIHWTRLVDLPLAAVIMALRPLLGEGGAEQVAAAIVPLITLGVAMALLATIARRTIAPAAWPLAPAFLLVAIEPLAMMSPLRIDHHGWQIAALLATTLGLVMRERRAGGVIAGLSLVASLTIGVEMLPYLGLAAVLAACAWVADENEAARLRPFAFIVGLGSVASLFLFIPPQYRFGVHCDALSGAYVWPALIGGVSLGAATLLHPARRVTRGALLLGAAVLAAVPLMGPAAGCLVDPYQGIDPDARRLWLTTITEAVPLFQQPLAIALTRLVLPTIGLVGAVLMVMRSGDDPMRRRAWILIATITAASIVFTIITTRCADAAETLGVPGATACAWLGRSWLARSRSVFVRALGSALLLMVVCGILPQVLIVMALGHAKTPAERAAVNSYAECMSPGALTPLNTLAPATALTYMDPAAALLVHTNLHTIAGPYHRNGRAIVDVIRAWGGDDATAQATVRAHHVSYVLLCGVSGETQIYRRRNRDGLSERLRRGQTPDWLTRVPLQGTPWQAWRVTARQ
jgi:hypothetical protein